MAKGPSNDELHERTLKRRAALLSLVRSGLSVVDARAHPSVGKIHASTYRKWRERDSRWATEVDLAREAYSLNHRSVKQRDLTSAQFALRYFQRERTAFQQQWIDDVESLRPGNILLALWPPEYGKTTTFEDYATERICRDPNWRNTTASESDSISKRVIGRVRQRLEPFGPFPTLVKDWGPFRPQTGQSAVARAFQPWNNAHFNVVQKQTADERDHTMLAIGWTSSTVSIRTDHLHLDDLQSLKTLSRTDQLLQWFRQDALSRPGESGITTINGTRVDAGDFYEALLEDDDLDGILVVRRYPAILFDAQGNPRPLWPEKHTLEQLERIRRKIKDDAFDRNYMMSPGASRTRRTFSEEGREKALDRSRSLNRFDPVEDGHSKPPMILSLDPGLEPGYCTLEGWTPTADTMTLDYFAESNTLLRNEQIIDMVAQACSAVSPYRRVLVLVVEAMNFQRGLARDERLQSVKNLYGFLMQEHLTGINKYDETIGVASMAGDWEAGKLKLPFAEDQQTQNEIGEFLRQLRTWRPGVRGNKLRQDRLVTMWFAWIWWQQNRHKLERKPTSWRRVGLPSVAALGAAYQPIIPIGATV